MKSVFVIIAFFALLAALYAGVPFAVQQSVNGQIYQEVKDVPAEQVALVLGAKVYADAELSDIYRDRLTRAVELYKNGKVKKILVSGSTEGDYYDEVTPAKTFLINNGVPERNIILDYAGFDTYDSIFRAYAVYQLDSAIIVSQNYHLPRALYIANQLNFPAVGMSADLEEYFNILAFQTRENLALFKAIFDTFFLVKPSVTETRTTNPAFAQ